MATSFACSAEARLLPPRSSAPVQCRAASRLSSLPYRRQPVTSLAAAGVPPSSFAPLPHTQRHRTSLPIRTPALPCGNRNAKQRGGAAKVRAVAAPPSSPPPRMIQHKQEAFWFYRFLSIVYDHVINPGHWTEDMRDDALEPAQLNSPDLTVVDVGGGTGFTTLGVVETVNPKNVTILDQSPHQLAKAREKPALADCTIVEGDAEDLPFPTDSCDRYVSAGSIEYWPDPQRGICEAYRVLKPGGLACIIGPVHPTFWLSRFFADVWMLFPREDEYLRWFKAAGFESVKLKRIGPKWYRGDRRHGLIMGCSVTGIKPQPGQSPLQLGPKKEDVRGPVNPLSFALRFVVGTLASLWFVIIPVYMWLKDQLLPKDWKFVEDQ